MVLCGWKGIGCNAGCCMGLCEQPATQSGCRCLAYRALEQRILMAFCFSCSDCDCTFKGRCKLREHLRSHTQEKVVACPTCGGMFANNTKFFDHIRRQTALDRKLLGAGDVHDCCSLRSTLAAKREGAQTEGRVVLASGAGFFFLLVCVFWLCS